MVLPRGDQYRKAARGTKSAKTSKNSQSMRVAHRQRKSGVPATWTLAELVVFGLFSVFRGLLSSVQVKP